MWEVLEGRELIGERSRKGGGDQGGEKKRKRKRGRKGLTLHGGCIAHPDKNQPPNPGAPRVRGGSSPG